MGAEKRGCPGSNTDVGRTRGPINGDREAIASLKKTQARPSSGFLSSRYPEAARADNQERGKVEFVWEDRRLGKQVVVKTMGVVRSPRRRREKEKKPAWASCPRA